MTDIADRITLHELQALRQRLSPDGTVNVCYWLVSALISELQDRSLDQDLKFARQTIADRKRRQARGL